MKKVILVFPDISSLADFVVKYRVKGAEVNSSEQTLSAPLTEELLKIATTEFEATPKRSNSFLFRD